MKSTSQKPILVTGAAGFIAARYVELCNQKKVPVISVDAPSYFTERTENKALDFGQIVDREKLFEWLEKEKPALAGIVHMGACTDTTELDEVYLKRMNTDYTKTLWNYATKHKLPFVYASSAATYGDGEFGYADDETQMARLKPLNPYGDSKLQFDLWALAEEKKGNHPPAWSGFKFFNVYGFGERHKNKMASVIVHAFDQIRTKGLVKLFKSHKEGIAHGHQKRDFVYVQDVVRVLDFALHKPITRGIFNLGSGQARTFLDLVKATFKAVGKPDNIEFIDTPIEIRDRYQYFTQAEMRKLQAQGYSTPFTSLENGVEEYVARLGKTL